MLNCVCVFVCLCVCVCGVGRCVGVVGCVHSLPSPTSPRGMGGNGRECQPKKPAERIRCEEIDCFPTKKIERMFFVRILGSCYCEGQRLAASCVDSPSVDPQGGGPHPQGGEPDACTFRRLTHLGCLAWLPHSRDPIAMQASGIR